MKTTCLYCHKVSKFTGKRRNEKCKKCQAYLPVMLRKRESKKYRKLAKEAENEKFLFQCSNKDCAKDWYFSSLTKEDMIDDVCVFCGEKLVFVKEKE